MTREHKETRSRHNEERCRHLGGCLQKDDAGTAGSDDIVKINAG